MGPCGIRKSISFAILTAACQEAEVLNDQVRGYQDGQDEHNDSSL